MDSRERPALCRERRLRVRMPSYRWREKMVMRVQIPSPAPIPQAVEEAREAGFVCGLFRLDTRGSVIRPSAAGCQCRNPSPAPMQYVQSRTDEPGEYRRNAGWLRNETDRSSVKRQFGWQHGTDGNEELKGMPRKGEAFRPRGNHSKRIVYADDGT